MTATATTSTPIQTAQTEHTQPQPKRKWQKYGTPALVVLLAAASPDLLDQLEKTEGVLDRKLDPVKAQTVKEEHIHLDEKTFRWMHNEDAMATEKLAEGIRKFNSDARHLEDYALSKVTQKSGELRSLLLRSRAGDVFCRAALYRAGPVVSRETDVMQHFTNTELSIEV